MVERQAYFCYRSCIETEDVGDLVFRQQALVQLLPHTFGRHS